MARHGDVELRTIMTRHVRTVGPETLAAEAVGMMIDQKFNSVPVVSEGGEVIGILTATDFLVIAQQALTGASFDRAVAEL
jgi:CBS domain-containing protein